MIADLDKENEKLKFNLKEEKKKGTKSAEA